MKNKYLLFIPIILILVILSYYFLKTNKQPLNIEKNIIASIEDKTVKNNSLNSTYKKEADRKPFGANGGTNLKKKTASYVNITADELYSIMQKRDLFLLDVHVPEQKHIKGTDAFIPYNSLVVNSNKLPKDKNTEIVVYCRSGSMSKIASEQLVQMGYTNVKNLVGGINAWNSRGYE